MSCESPDNRYILKCFNFVWLGGNSNININFTNSLFYKNNNNCHWDLIIRLR